MKHFLQATAVAGGLALACVAGPAFAATMQCQPGQQITTPYPSGSTYTADGAGVVTSVSAVDVNVMHQSGCVQIGVTNGLCGELLNVNMNVGGAGAIGDQLINWFVPATQSWRLTKITARNASRSFAAGSAAGGIYTAAAKGGTVVVLAATNYVGMTDTAATANQDLAIVAAPGKTEFINNPLYFSLTTADGSAGTIDLFLYCDTGN
jgi:hypothetical protein